MKLFLASFLFLISIVYSQEFTVKTVPNPKTLENSFLSDPNSILDKQTYSQINSILVQLEAKTSNEFAVVILPSIGNETPKVFANELFNFWGVGKKEKNNGLLLLLVLDQRRYEFETGYGLEGDLPDAYLKRVGSEFIVPNMKEKNPNQAILSAVEEISNKLNKLETKLDKIIDAEKNLEIYSKEREENKNFHSYSWEMIAIYILYSIFSYIFLQVKGVRGNKYSGILTYNSFVNWRFAFTGYSLFILHFIYLGFIGADLLSPILKSIFIYFGLISFFSEIDYLNILNKRKYSDPYDHYKSLDKFLEDWEFIIPCFLFFTPMLTLLAYILIKKRKLRLAPRISKKSNLPMTRLSEDKEDFFLKEGQKLEETIGSVDYDVWFCEQSKEIKIYAYESFFTSYSKCPSCSYKTRYVESDEVIDSPTCTSSGKGIRHYACKNCSHKNSESYTIPQRDCSKSSGSSSSGSYSSSSSSSFGGGSSGGGGAGGSW
jgi:uncharacterized protein